ncbi:amino acid adenylation domain-containing protein [Streptomyces boninensis]|uniref:amino acid adenylation domain-containing protein n=1 Tax=Streptomyces boninensis TaxID=2039455 RepID=UPI003B2254FE
MSAPPISADQQERIRAELLRRRLAGRGGRRAGAGRIPPADRGAPLQLSAGQRSLWFLHQLDPDSRAYLLPIVLRLSGALDLARLRGAVNALAARHEILRTRYVLDGGQPVQVVDPAGDVDWQVVEMPGVPGERRDAEAAEFAHAAAEPMDLAAEPPLRVRVLRFGPDDHVLVVVLHHIAADAPTRPLLLRDLGALYRGTELPPLAVQYADYAAWLNTRQAGPRAAERLDWWRRELDGLAPLELPTDRARPAVRDDAGAVAGFEVPPWLAARLRALAKEADGTLFMVLLAAFQVLLGRYAGTQDVAVGTAVSGRGREELAGMAGYAYNSLALRARWTGDPAFRELLAAGRGRVLDALDHQDVPFDRIADELEPQRDLSRTPLFQVMFDLAPDGAGSGLDLPEVTARPVPATGRIARFDLTLHLAERPDGGLTGSLEYATALFDAATAERLTGHYTRLLTAAAEHPDAPLSALEMLSPAERSLLLDGPAEPVGGGEPVDLATLLPVPQGIAAQMAATPDATALVHPGGSVTYAELDGLASAFACRLAGLGAGTDDTVGVLLDRGPDLVGSLLGCWRAGAAYLPIDPGYPDDRIAYMLADTGTRLVVTERKHADRFTGTGVRLIVVDDPEERAAIEAAPASVRDGLPAATDPDQLAYVIYTSGSTGRPKGVLVTHRGLAGYLGWTARAYAKHPGGAPVFSSIAFDLGVPNLYTPLLTGQPAHLLPQDFEVDQLGALLAAGGPYGFIKLTPGHLDLLQQQLTDDQIASLAGLVIAAGDAFTARLAERWAASAGEHGTRLAAEYGPTEITVGNSAYFIDGPVPTELVSIGRAIPHTTMYVLDDRLRPLPIGVTGEVWIGGIGLARGYASRPGLTAERFVPDPYGPPGARLYRTGDLARVLPDGGLDFVGRVDHQVKLRGYRIEPGEVEAALTGHPAVAEAVALVREDSPGDRQLVAYLVPAPDADAAELAPQALRERLGEGLPAYLVPSAFVLLDALPLTGNGKLDRRALPAPGRGATAVGEHTAARDDAERVMAGVWAEVLGLDEVGVHDNFFDLGGDSIRAVALVGALRAAGWETSVRDVFEHRTVARLRAALGDAGAAADAGHGPVAPFALISAEDRAALPAEVTDAYPLSRIQAGMLIEMHDVSGENRYHNITSFRIRDELPFDPEAFRRACALITERHEVMRTGFDMTGYSQPLQLVHATAAFPVVHEDLRGLPEQDREQALWDFCDRDRSELFDLARPPLMRMAVHLLDDESWWLSITECHPVIEGWSYHSQLMELLRAYRRIRTDEEPEPAPVQPKVRYADFIAAELRSLDGDGDRAYWQGITGGYEKFTLPPGWDGEAAGDDERCRIDIPLDDVEPGLRALAAAAGVPYKSVLHAAHAKVLSLLTASDAFRGGMVADARPEEAGAEQVSGMYLNSVPFPYRRPESTWGELARQVFDAEISLWPHRRFPMPAMRAPGGDRHLIDVLFHYLDFHQVDTELIDIMASRDDSPNEFKLVVGTPVRGHFSIASRPGILAQAAAGRLAALYRAVFADMAATGTGGDARGGYPEAAERRRLAAPPLPYPDPPRDVLAAIEEQAARTPRAIAVRGPDGAELSYAGLRARAGRIAARLRGLGAGPGGRVAVLLDRGPDLVAALLGVWQAGAVQVPLDPDTPVDRIAAIAARLGLDAAVTQPEYAARLDGAGVLLLTEWVTDDEPAEPPLEAYDADRSAYILHTSGSTGEPKGVEVSHGALAHYLDWAVREYAAAGGGAPYFTSAGFDLGVPALYAPLMTGQTVRMLPQCFGPAELGTLLAAGAPYAFVGLTPGHLALLEDELSDAELAGLAAVAVCAGDAYPADQARRVAARIAAAGGGMRLATEYGPTEATVAATAGPAPAGRGGRALVPLGSALPGAVVRLLDGELRPVPDGVTGEVWLGGAGLARGYAGQPAATAAAFRPDPYGPPGTRLYRTGDLARRLPDGTLEFAGRADGQVKIRGHRVEPGEVEAVLAADPAVRAALVAALPAADGGQRLAAWVVPEDGAADCSPRALRDRLRRLLPAAALPGVFRTVDRLPLTGNGKRDRALVADRAATAAQDLTSTAPRTTTERVLAQVWAEVLGLDEVGVHDDFRDLGGDSLLVPPLLLAARNAGLDLDLATALRHHTVARLAAALDARRAPQQEES